MVARMIAAHPYCTECGTTGSRANPLSGDHIVAQKHGGRGIVANVQVLCRVCNSRKGDRA